MMPNNENFEICSECGGKCCLNLPGNAYPTDFGFEQMTPDEITSELKKMFSSQNWQIDWWEGYNSEENGGHQGIFIRPATKSGQGKIYHGAWDHEGCVFHAKNKCTLPFDSRPYECKELVPRRDKCFNQKPEEGRHPKLLAIDAWKPYEDLVTQVASELGETVKPKDEDSGVESLFSLFSKMF